MSGKEWSFNFLTLLKIHSHDVCGNSFSSRRGEMRRTLKNRFLQTLVPKKCVLQDWTFFGDPHIESRGKVSVHRSRNQFKGRLALVRRISFQTHRSNLVEVGSAFLPRLCRSFLKGLNAQAVGSECSALWLIVTKSNNKNDDGLGSWCLRLLRRSRSSCADWCGTSTGTIAYRTTCHIQMPRPTFIDLLHIKDTFLDNLTLQMRSQLHTRAQFTVGTIVHALSDTRFTGVH